MLFLLFGWGVFLNWKYEKELKKARRKYDEQNGTSTSIGGDSSGCGETVNSVEPRVRTEEQNGSNEERRDIQDTINLSSTTNQPEPTAIPEPTDGGVNEKTSK